MAIYTDDPTTWPPEWPYTNQAPANNWRPGQKPRFKKMPRETIDSAIKLLRSQAARPTFDLTDLRYMADQGCGTTLLCVGVANLRERGHSWAEIGTVLGVSRAAAYMRFAPLMEAAS